MRSRRHQRAAGRSLRALQALALVGVAWFTSAQAQAQEGARPRIAIVVVATGEVDEQIKRDVQDLFLAGLARFSDHEPVDRVTLYKTSDLEGDVDFLLCVHRPGCLEAVHEQTNTEQFVVVKLEAEEQGDQLTFSAATFSYTNGEEVAFSAPRRLSRRDPGQLIDAAFSAAEAVELAPVEPIVAAGEDPCEDVECPEGERCKVGQCVAVEPSGQVLEPARTSPWVSSGLALIGLGVAGLSASAFYAIDADEREDALASSAAGPARLSAFDQQRGYAEADAANDARQKFHVFLGVGGGALAAGAGLLIWGLIEAPPQEKAPEALSLQLTPRLDPLGRGAGLSATVHF